MISCQTKTTFIMRNSTLWKNSILSFILFGFAVSFAYSQERTVTGKVTSEEVGPLPGVPDTTSLGEIVFTGYGTQKKKEITGAISSVKFEEFVKGNVNNPEQLVQGKVAGLSISKAGGNPNEGYTIRLRGLNTIHANTQPLVVIDGVPGASLDNVDPNDIESMDVLKDGSAAAIYGTRGFQWRDHCNDQKGKNGYCTN